jgi:hypothetical protein
LVALQAFDAALLNETVSIKARYLVTRASTFQADTSFQADMSFQANTSKRDVPTRQIRRIISRRLSLGAAMQMLNNTKGRETFRKLSCGKCYSKVRQYAYYFNRTKTQAVV